MFHFDYSWDLGPYGIILDEELNTDQLDWKEGDLFQLVEINGKKVLKRLDKLESFIRQGEINESVEL